MDPIADFINALKLAGLARHASVTVPHSKIKLAIAELLKKEGYVKAVNEGNNPYPTLEVVLLYEDKFPRIKGVTRVSKPSKRVYSGSTSLRKVKYGHGLAVLSTPKGILSDKQAKAEHVGGEVLFHIW